MADFATVDDLDALMIDRDLTARERAKAPAQLARASAIMRQAVPTLDGPDGPPGTAVGVCCAMVLRVIRNPDGDRAVAIDDYSRTRDSSLSTGELYLSDAEEAQLRPPRSSTGAFSIVPGAPPCEATP